MAGATLILREGLEAALIVAAVLAVVRRTGARRAARAVHAGWISALGAGIATFALARTLIASLAVQREVVEGAVSVLAAGVLFATSFWLISKADAKRWLAYVKARAAGSAESGRLFGLASVAFLAVYREAFESVLFFEALAGGDRARVPAIAGGAAAGGAALALAVYAIGRLERRLPLAPFFGISGAALSAFSVVLLGHGVHALQQTVLLAPRPLAFRGVAWLGVYPDAVGLAAQGALAAAIVVTSLAVLARRPRPGATAPS
jgi:high-affinity iron transporter